MKTFICIILLLFTKTSFCQQNFEKIQSWQEENTAELGGRSVLLIYKDGKMLYNNAVNDMSRKQKIVTKIMARKKGKDGKEMVKDFSENTIMPIASCSKWLSAALVLTFVDEGKLTLQDTVGKYLTTLIKTGKGNITIAQCLSHTTGINAGDLKESIKQFKNANSMDDAMAIIAPMPIDSKPGESFRYSNVGLQIAGAVIEKISGKDFKTLFKERIATPCQMLNSNFGDTNLPIPAGSAQSNALDYLHFLIMILNEGNYNGKQILKKETIRSMQKSYTFNKKIMYSPKEAGNWSYGLGEWLMSDVIENERSKVVSSPGLFGTFPWVNNKMGYCAILFTFNVNSKGRNEKYIELKDLVDNIIK
jgi:CubicO group peptidase (beta-lactamase class C family)